ncbi:hypothetical protein [Pseudorhodobacter ferrugineus]|uniref:hypothetical protein n=1 Tax=Pseudorhodobacter ferrugineus TaxID=77008 RepID=UPI0012DD1560|nr:hypothetical protein [Pseudorhodobacter ferrugineus]
MVRRCSIPIATQIMSNGIRRGYAMSDCGNAVWDGLKQMFEELPRGLTLCLVHELGDCELG